MISERNEPADLLSAVEYQEGAVVSKVLLKNRSGSVTLFAFAAGEELSEHTVPHDALVQVLHGAAEITISGNRFGVKTGEAIILPSGVPHALRAAERFKMILTMIRPPTD